MDFEQAMRLLAEVGASFHGTLQDHQAIQQALSVVRSNKCNCKDTKNEVEAEKKKD